MIFFKPFILIMIIVSFSFSSTSYVSKSVVRKIEKKYNKFAKKRFFYQEKLLKSLKNSTDIEKLNGINKFYNSVRFSTDMKIYGKSDYWATPYQFLAKDMGDCEDYVIAKYFALKYLKMDVKKLFFFYVRSTKFKESHMVLAYYKKPSSMPLILDNNNFKVLPANKRRDLKPIFRVQAGQVEKISTGKKVKSKKVGRMWDQLVQNIKRKKI
ncbi:MAG: transglutaminase-like cysteine peptidase [Campylobacterota bacterium]|nr:transglutaminase-like cysteine peptidase [Campylobacterota bacterium]